MPENSDLTADEIILAAQFAVLLSEERQTVSLSAKGRLDRSPRKNWVEKTGRLPKYIEDIALALERKGMPLQRAIPTAISRIKVWAAGGDNVKADTRAKARKALAQWTALKAKNKARMAKNVALSDVSLLGADETDVVALAGNVIRRVRTPEGVKKYKQPIGSVIISDGKGNVLKVLHKGDGTLNGPSAASFQNDPKVAEYGTAKKGEFKSQSGVSSRPEASPESKAPKASPESKAPESKAPKASPESKAPESKAPESKAPKDSPESKAPMSPQEAVAAINKYDTSDRVVKSLSDEDLTKYHEIFSNLAHRSGGYPLPEHVDGALALDREVERRKPEEQKAAEKAGREATDRANSSARESAADLALEAGQAKDLDGVRDVLARMQQVGGTRFSMKDWKPAIARAAESFSVNNQTDDGRNPRTVDDIKVADFFGLQDDYDADRGRFGSGTVGQNVSRLFNNWLWENRDRVNLNDPFSPDYAPRPKDQLSALSRDAGRAEGMAGIRDALARAQEVEDGPAWFGPREWSRAISRAAESFSVNNQTADGRNPRQVDDAEIAKYFGLEDDYDALRGEFKYPSLGQKVSRAFNDWLWENRDRVNLNDPLVSEASGPSSKASKPSYHGIRPGDYTEDSFTPQDVEQRAKDIDAHLDKVLADGDTRTRFSSPTEVDGVRMYTPERKALHKEILSGMVAQANQNRVPRDGQAYISGGLPGAGKSYVLKNRMGLDTSKYVTLNPDDFKEMLANRTTVPGTEDGSFSPMEMAAVLHEESSDLSKAAIDLFTSLGYNVILDVTLGGSGDKAKAKHRATVERLRSRGYSVDGVFVDIPHAMSRESAGARYLRGFADWLNGSSDMGGRYVPAHVAAGDVSTMGFNSSNRDNFESVKDLFRDFRVVDNSVRDRAAEMRVLDDGGSGRSTASSDPFVSNNFDPLSDPISRLEAILDSMRVT